MEKVLLSIIVPIYNTASYLSKCVESILNQEYKNFELLLVDDGSTDNSLEVCKRYAAIDNRIQIINKDNGGLISAKKAGLNVAKGSYVGFVDSDDWIDTNMYSCLMKAALENCAEVIVGGNVTEYPEHTVKVIQGVAPGLYKKEDLIQYIYPNLIFKDNIYALGISPSLCTKIFKRELVKKYQDKVDERIKAGEDAACTYPCLLEANSVEFVEGCYSYHYRIHSTSMTHRKEKMDVDEKIALLSHLYYSFALYDYPDLEKQFYLYSVNILNDFIINCYENRIRQREMLYIVDRIRNSCIWEILEKDNEEQLPVSIIRTLEYLKNPSVAKDLELRFSVTIQCKKQALRVCLSPIKQKILRGLRN